MRVLGVLVLLTVGLFATPVWADEEAEEEPSPAPLQSVVPTSEAPVPLPDRPRQHNWYGWQVMMADAASVTSVHLGLEQRSEELALLGVGGYFFGGPLVHWAHGHVGKGFGSLGIRVGAPIAGAMIGEWEGLALGFVGAWVIDAAALAHENVEEERPKSGWQLAPVASITPKQSLFGVSGAF